VSVTAKGMDNFINNGEDVINKITHTLNGTDTKFITVYHRSHSTYHCKTQHDKYMKRENM